MVAPVGMFEANALALHDMLGNAAEWVLDCRTESYEGASGHADDAKETGQCAYRTLRGGSWHSDENVTRAAYRDWTTPITRGSMIGFRLVREM
jgi:formylglycine-generating enzyme required for sulfatase activity